MTGERQRTEIGANSVVTGEIRSQEDIVVFGEVKGSVDTTCAVLIEEGGSAHAQISASQILVAGAVVGNLHATERIEVTEKGRVLGDLVTPRLILQEGGAIRGRVLMEGARIAAAPQVEPQKGLVPSTVQKPPAPESPAASASREFPPRRPSLGLEPVYTPVPSVPTESRLDRLSSLRAKPVVPVPVPEPSPPDKE